MTERTPDFPRDQAAAYVLGTLSAEEAREFEAYLTHSAVARRDVAEFREVAALLTVAGSEPAATPPPELRERVLARLRGTDRERAPGLERTPEAAAAVRVRRTPLLWGALAASLAALAALGIGASAARRELAGARAALAAREHALTDLRRRLAERERTLRAVLGPGVEMFQLTSTGDPDPRMQLFWDRERRRVLLYGTRLPRLAPDSAYQLWFIRDGEPVPSATFTPSTAGDVQLQDVPVPTDGVLSAAAITIEPSAGSPQPTTPVVIVGSLERTK